MSTTIRRTNIERSCSRPENDAVPASVGRPLPTYRAATLALSFALALPPVAGVLVGTYRPAEDARETRQKILFERARAASSGLEAELNIGMRFAAAQVAIEVPRMQGSGR